MDLAAIPTFVEGTTFHVVVESPRGSVVKMKYEPRWETMSVSRPLALGLSYPCDWGFVPSTKGPDGDPLDALVYWDSPTYPGVVLPCRAAGILCIEQNHGEDASRRIRNDRLLAVPLASRRESSIASIEDLLTRTRDELAHFTIATTALEGKHAKFLGWDGPAAALALIERLAIGRG
jgi:inorganic pyrophosphatase